MSRVLMILMIEMMQLVPLAWIGVRVEAKLTLLPLSVLQCVMTNTLPCRTHHMVVDLQREVVGSSLRRSHVPNIMIDKHSMEGMIMVIGTTMGMGSTTNTLDRMFRKCQQMKHHLLLM